MKKHIFITVIALITFLANTAESIQIKDFVEAARKQIGRTLFYDPSYQVIDYPNGDVPIDRGVCTDVIVRALRVAYNYDLQEFVHEDMEKNFSKYPQIWGLNQPDKNIDHRRVPNLQTFFERKGWSLPLSNHLPEFKPGDLVTCIIPPNLPHIMIVSDRRSKDNILLVIHNIGNGTQEEDRLFEFELTGHYRIKRLRSNRHRPGFGNPNHLFTYPKFRWSVGIQPTANDRQFISLQRRHKIRQDQLLQLPDYLYMGNKFQ